MATRGEEMLREKFPVITPIQVRFRDMDAMGHVNNAVYLTYLEMGRIAYYTTLFGPNVSARDFNFILAHVEVDFRSPVHLGEEIFIGTRVERVGNQSFHFTYEIREGATGRLVAEAKSVQVMYDYQRQQTMSAIPEEFVARLEALEGRPLR